MPAGEPFSPRQRADLDRALKVAEETSGLGFSLYVGDLQGGRDQAVAMQSTMVNSERGVLVAVDPSRRALEIVTGNVAAHALDQRACTLAGVTMTSAFSQGDLVGGLKRGIQLLGAHGRHEPIKHLDEPV